MFVTTATSAGRPKTVPSDSSPSTTSQPAPEPAFAPSCGTGAPMSQAGLRPVSRRTNAIIAAVVPFPCVPATTIERRSATSSASSAARGRPATAGYAEETTTSHPSGTTGSGAISSGTSRSCSRYGVSTRSHPPTSAPQARASCAYAERPAPPMPTNQIRLPSSGREGNELLSNLVRRVRTGDGQHRRAHPAQPRLVVEQRAHEVGNVVEIELAHHDRSARAHEVLGVLRLVVARREGVRDEHCGPAGGGDLPDRPARAGKDEVARRDRRAALVRLGEHAVVVTPRAPLDELEVAQACDVQDRRAALAEGVDDELVQRPRAGERAEDDEHLTVVREIEDEASLVLWHRARPLGNRAADDAVLPAVPGVDREREEHAPRVRRREAVREAEVRVGLRQRRRDPHRCRGEHHRPRDEAAGAEDDVRPAAPEDLAACER